VLVVGEAEDLNLAKVISYVLCDRGSFSILGARATSAADLIASRAYNRRIPGPSDVRIVYFGGFRFPCSDRRLADWPSVGSEATIISRTADCSVHRPRPTRRQHTNDERDTATRSSRKGVRRNWVPALDRQVSKGCSTIPPPSSTRPTISLLYLPLHPPQSQFHGIITPVAPEVTSRQILITLPANDRPF